MRKYFPNVARPDANADADADSYTDTDADADSHANADADTHADTDTDTDAHTYAGQRRCDHHRRTESGAVVESGGGLFFGKPVELEADPGEHRLDGCDHESAVELLRWVASQ